MAEKHDFTDEARKLRSILVSDRGRVKNRDEKHDLDDKRIMFFDICDTIFMIVM